MAKTDFKKTLRHLYAPSSKDFSIVDVPQMQFLRIDGEGAPESEAYTTAIGWLYGVAYPVKFASKLQLDKDYTVMPLEGLWWAEDFSAFTEGDRDAWKWTAMIMQPDWITDEILDGAVEKASGKLGEPPASLRLEPFTERLSVQIMHIGPYSAEAPTIARLHREFIPENGLTENGHHHELYLGDPRRTAPERLKTVLRQPVRRV
ncbi:MAG: GyrI-like domain-containing protein [Acidimicrobiia bacterium]|jgi:hypothetical protein